MHYRLKRTTDLIPLPEGGLLLKTDTISFRMEGNFAQLFQTKILPGAADQLELGEVASRLGLPAGALSRNFDELVEAGFFERSDAPFPAEYSDPRSNLVRALGLSKDLVERRLGRARIAVFGLEPPGALVAEGLLRAGFQNILLVDPGQPVAYELEEGESAEGLSREALVAARLKRCRPSANLCTSGCAQVTREGTEKLGEGLDLMMACWDHGFASGNHWVNRAAQTLGVPAIFCDIRGIQLFAGPFVIPGMAACFMCARMRAVAAAEEFEEAMASEKYYDQLKKPDHSRRQVWGPALSTMASLMVSEAMKFLVLSQQPSLLGGVAEYDPFELTLKRHALLEHPACPVCSQKKNYSRVSIPAWRS